MSLANYITLFRIFITPLFFTLLVSYESGQEARRWAALAVFAVAGFTDALDGLLARLSGTQTELGRFLDPLADKLLLLSGYLGLLFVPSLPFRPPLWITVTIVFRDVLIIMGLILIFLMTGSVRVQPNLLGKFTTGFQMITLIAILLAWEISIPLCYATAVLTIVSCLVYLIRELRQLKPT